MAETMQMIVAGVRQLLRGVSEAKLPDIVIRTQAQDALKQFIQEDDLSNRQRRTRSVEVEFTTGDEDFSVGLEDIPEFEAVKLEYWTGRRWLEANIVDFQAWSRHQDADYVAAAFYGDKNVKVNRTTDDVVNATWRLSYRESLLAVLQLGDKPPLSSAHLPMLKREVAVLCIPLVTDDTEEWKVWVDRFLPQYEAKLLELRTLYLQYLDSSVEPQLVPIKRFDDFRRRVRLNTRGFLPPVP